MFKCIQTIVNNQKTIINILNEIVLLLKNGKPIQTNEIPKKPIKTDKNDFIPEININKMKLNTRQKKTKTDTIDLKNIESKMKNVMKD